MPKTILEYIGLDLNKIPKSIQCEKPKFSITKVFDNSDLYKVYKTLDVKEIEILISDTDRTTDIKERYNKAIPICDYIKEYNNEFKTITENTTPEELEAIELQQEEFKKQIPYFIKYDKNYSWQIYYSKSEDKYFMLFPSRETDSSTLMYLIMKKLQRKKNTIYVPICKEQCSQEFISANKLNDIENYIWLFTGDWPKILEVVGKDKRLYITGRIKVENDFFTKYRCEFKSKEEVEDFYTLIKALFIISTETKYIYKFEPGLNSKGSLSFFYNQEEITNKKLKEFVTRETAKQQNLKYEYIKMTEENQKVLESIKEIIDKQVELYNRQEKQIATYLSCKKSFFKKVRFFFTNNKKISIANRELIESVKKEVKTADKSQKQNIINETNIDSVALSMFTISDLVKTSLETKKKVDEYNNLQADINAMRIKEKNMEHKIENAQVYLDEIEEHKKSIFEFWRYTNKDNQNSLAEGQGEDTETKKQISFSLDEDFKEFAANIDSLQRKKLSNDECDALFVAHHLLPGINSVVTKSDTYVLDEEYEQLAEAYESKDKSIFGNITEDYRKVKILNNKQFREHEKDLYSILRFNEFTTLEDFKDRMKEMGALVNEAYQKLTAKYNMTIYYAKRNKGYIKGEVNPYNLLADPTVKRIYRTQTLENTHIIYMSNIVFYDNSNKTLPLGMDRSTEIITKVGENKKVSDATINLLIEKDLYTVEIRKIKIIEEAKRNL